MEKYDIALNDPSKRSKNINKETFLVVPVNLLKAIKSNSVTEWNLPRFLALLNAPDQIQTTVMLIVMNEWQKSSVDFLL